MSGTLQTHPALKTRATELFGVDHPVVQTGMGNVSDARLTAATANAGGLGILAAGMLTYEELVVAIDEIQGATDKPFGVNVRANQPDVHKRIDLMIRKGVRVASFALAPKRDLIAKCKDAGLVVMPSIGARRHAEKVAEWGADAVIVQGGEGGGHTGQVPTSLLLPQVVDATDLVVIGAGGYFDGRGLVSALAYGAEGIAMGTRFMLTRESPVVPSVKDVYLTKSLDDTVVTTQVDGVPQRVVRSGPVEQLEKSGRIGQLRQAATNARAFQKLSGARWRDMVSEGVAMRRSENLTWSQVVMAANAPMLYRTALLEGNPEAGVMATGQVVGMIDDLPSCEELVSRIVREASEVLARFSA